MKNFLIKRAVKFRYKQDCHPKKGFGNWWEDLGFYKSKSAKRLQLKRELLSEYNTNTSALPSNAGEDIVRTADITNETAELQDKELVS